jgi:hypothetical protein
MCDAGAANKIKIHNKNVGMPRQPKKNKND